MVKLEPEIKRMYENGLISIDDVDSVNSALLQGRTDIDQFKMIVVHATMNALAEKLVKEEVNLTPLLMQVLEIRYQELTDQELTTKGEVLKSAEKVWIEMGKPLSVSAILDPEVLSLVATFTLPEKILQKSCFGIKVDSMFTDPLRSKLEISGSPNKGLKIFTNWNEYTENLKGNNSLVLLGRISVGVDTELAKSRLLHLIACGNQIAVPLKLPHLFRKNDWKQLEEAIGKSSIPEGEIVLYMENMVIKKPLNLATLKRSWERIYEGCYECPHNIECAPEAIF